MPFFIKCQGVAPLIQSKQSEAKGENRKRYKFEVPL